MQVTKANKKVPLRKRYQKQIKRFDFLRRKKKKKACQECCPLCKEFVCYRNELLFSVNENGTSFRSFHYFVGFRKHAPRGVRRLN